MLRQKEFGVLSGSEYFFGTLAMQKQALFYSVHMCGHYYCDKRYRIDRQGLDCLMLMLVENGTMELQFHEKTITAHSGDILLFCYFCHSFQYFCLMETIITPITRRNM